jgi:hypothetical protein
MDKNMPQIIKDVGFDFSWDEEKVWALNEPIIEMSIDELRWHFDIPFWDENGETYNLKPIDVIECPDDHKVEYERTMVADLSFPIDIMKNKGRWLILDGLHRLVQAAINGSKTVKVRVIPRERIPEIEANR